MSEDEVKSLDLFTPEQLLDVNAFLKYFPRLKIECTVDETSNIAVFDIIYFKIKVTRENLEEGEEQGFVHSAAYPFLKKEKLLVLLCDAETEREMYGMTYVDGYSRESIIPIQY
jgi:hypothetical protein